MRAVVRDETSARVELRVEIRIQATTGGRFHGGTLDLHVHLPRIAPSDSDLQTEADARYIRGAATPSVERFFELLEETTGIGRGEVQVFEDDPSLVRVHDLRLSTELPAPGVSEGTRALQVLFTREIVRTDGETVTGYTPAIPGAAARFETSASGITVALTDSVEANAITMLHETGHFVGLNHTTELDGRTSDPLPDTPRCILPAPSSDTTTSMALDRCDDRQNVMFGVAPARSPVTLSLMQLRVFRGSPIYRAH